MAMDNVELGRMLEDIADLLEIVGENVFRVRAYRNAARTIETLPEPASVIAERGGLKALAELPGIGKDLAGKIVATLETGHCETLDELLRKVPAGLVDIMRLPSVGPKRAKLLHDEIGIHTLDALERAARDGELQAIRGFGKVLEAKILEGCRKRHEVGARVPLAEADTHLAPLLAHMRSFRHASRVETAGSVRRRRETIGDLDVLVASTRPSDVAERFVGFGEVVDVLARGETKCSVRLACGMQADLRVVAPDTFGAALHYFTGSKAHNVAIRTLGVKRGLKISEYGVFRDERRIGGAEEEDVFRAVGLPYIPPELREDRGEIEAARAGTLPELVTLDDVRGDLHAHTTATDGHDSIVAMARAAAARGYAYLGITDHTRSLHVASGLGPKELRDQSRAIARARAEVPEIAILHGAEVDILADGNLDLDDATLDRLDYVIAAVHSKLDQPEAALTSRVLRALENPRVSIFAHPSGRLLGRRAPSALDLGKVVRAAADLGVILEIDSQPDRLDLDDVHARMAHESGVKLVIDTDAHRAGELAFMRYGIDQARRGWCTARDVVNTLPLGKLRAALHARRAHGHHARAAR
jgi:DNA polymerase (family 10)